VFGVILVFFGFHLPDVKTIAIALVAGVLHLVAIYFYYAALKAGEASQTLAIMGGFSPVATALIAVALLAHPFGGSLTGFVLMVSGGFLMFVSEKLDLRKILPAVLIASGTFGLVNVMDKIVFNRTNFVSGYVFFTIGTFLGAMALLIPPSWRKQIFTESEKAEPRSRFWYFVNRFISGVGSFLIFYAVSLTSPAIVDAITGLRYAIIFIGAYALTKMRPDWLQEQFTGRAFIVKCAATLLIVAGLVWLGLNGRNNGESSAARLLKRGQDQNCSSVTPIATSTAAAHLRLSTCSRNTCLASSVSKI
jgi:drug/metabolite transporter (DMT)-like permease